MKLPLAVLVACIFTSCTPQMMQFMPNHIGVVPSVEFEIQEHVPVKTKPKIQTNFDWNI